MLKASTLPYDWPVLTVGHGAVGAHSLGLKELQPAV